MPTRMDTSIPDYFMGVQVISGQNIIGPLVPLYGAVCVRADVWTQNGGAGSLNVYTSTFDASLLPVTTIYPPQSGLVQANVSANNTAYATLAANAAQLGARWIWLQFSPSANGTVYVALNIRRACV